MMRIWLAALAWLMPALVSAAPCPEVPPRPEGARIDGTPSRLAAAHATTVIAGGDLLLAGCAKLPGDGHIPKRPQVNLMLAEATGGPLVLRTESACDTVLLARGADGTWVFDDDGAGGHDARLALPGAQAGRYDIWVGSFERGTCAARLILSME